MYGHLLFNTLGKWREPLDALPYNSIILEKKKCLTRHIQVWCQCQTVQNNLELDFVSVVCMNHYLITMHKCNNYFLFSNFICKTKQWNNHFLFGLITIFLFMSLFDLTKENFWSERFSWDQLKIIRKSMRNWSQWKNIKDNLVCVHMTCCFDPAVQNCPGTRLAEFHLFACLQSVPCIMKG